MTIVGIQHQPWHKNLFWFSVPDKIKDKIDINDWVMCDTAKGKQPGVVKVRFSSENEEDGIDFIRRSYTDEKYAGKIAFPLKSVVAISEIIPIDSIAVPEDMEKTFPPPEEWEALLARANPYLYEIFVDENHVLKSGYAYYLADKMLGYKEVRVYQEL